MTIEQFSRSDFSLLVYLDGRIIFRSKKNDIRSILDYLQKFPKPKSGVMFFDKVVGRCAALLFVKAKAREVYTPKISKGGLLILKKHKIVCHYLKIVPVILNLNQTGPCPFEKLSYRKSPEQIYHLLLDKFNV